MKDLVSLAVAHVGPDKDKVREKIQEFVFRLEAGESWDDIEKTPRPE